MVEKITDLEKGDSIRIVFGHRAITFENIDDNSLIVVDGIVHII